MLMMMLDDMIRNFGDQFDLKNFGLFLEFGGFSANWSYEKYNFSIRQILKPPTFRPHYNMSVYKRSPGRQSVKILDCLGRAHSVI